MVGMEMGENDVGDLLGTKAQLGEGCRKRSRDPDPVAVALFRRDLRPHPCFDQEHGTAGADEEEVQPKGNTIPVIGREIVGPGVPGRTAERHPPIEEKRTLLDDGDVEGAELHGSFHRERSPELPEEVDLRAEALCHKPPGEERRSRRSFQKEKTGNGG
jgi:hypothetical protein